MEKSNGRHDNLEYDIERINIIYTNANISYFGTVLTTLFLGFFIYKFSSLNTAVFWMLAVFFVYLPRVILSINYMRQRDNQKICKKNIKSWERYFILNSILPSLVFASVYFLPYKENTSIAILLCTIVIVAMIAAGAALYSTSKSIFFLFLNVYILPLIARYFWMGDIISITLGCFLIIFYIFMIRLISNQNNILLENIALKIENKKFSLIDPLTKLLNRRRLDLHIEKLLPTSKRSGEPFSLIILDIDHFKEYNDTRGYSAGDELLIKISGILLGCSREQDLVVRYGGEEFLVVLPETKINDAATIAERIRTTVKENTDVTISAGLAEYNEKFNFEQLVGKADEALYSAKNNGRDQYVLVTV